MVLMLDICKTTLNGEEEDCEDVDDLNAIEQQRVLHLKFEVIYINNLIFININNAIEQQGVLHLEFLFQSY